MTRTILCFVLAFCGSIVVLSCSSAGPSIRGTPDARAESAVCGASLGADHLSFDLACMATCTASRHVTFNVAPGDREGAPCVDQAGHLQLYQLVGEDQSVFELDVEPGYTGVGAYGLGSAGLVQYSNVSVTCPEVGNDTLEIELPDPLTDPKGACSISVSEDCVTSSGRHAISGKLSCAFPVTDRGADCSIQNGTFSFRDCE